MVGAGNAFPSAVALIPFGDNVDTRVLLKKILDACSDCSIRYSPLGQVGHQWKVDSVGWNWPTCHRCSSQIQKSSHLPLLYSKFGECAGYM